MNPHPMLALISAPRLHWLYDALPDWMPGLRGAIALELWRRDVLEVLRREAREEWT